MAAALLQSLPWLAEGDEGLNALLLTLTGGLDAGADLPGFLALSYQHRLAAAGAGAGGAAG